MKRLLVGLTGGIAAGKSLALDEFARRGARTVCLDEAARRVTAPGMPGLRRVARAFGPGVLDAAGRLDRKRLGERVFSKPGERRRLERLLHPLILREMERRLSRFKGLAVVDVPLLFEAGLASRFDVTVLVTAPSSLRLARLRARDGLTAAQARRRMAAQMPQRLKEQRADVALPNDGRPSRLRRRVAELHQALDLIQKGRTP